MKRRLVTLATAAALLSVASAPAQAQAPATATQLIHAGRLLDRPGNPPRGNSTIVVREGKVVAVRDGFSPPEPGAAIIDLRTKYLLPGFVDVHVHIGGAIDGGASAAQNSLRAGFTTLRHLGSSNGRVAALRARIASGEIVGPRILDVIASVAPTYGWGDPRIDFNGKVRPGSDVNARPLGVCDSPDECRRTIRILAVQGADAIKVFATGLSTSPISPTSGAQFTLEELRAIVDTANQFQLKVTAHAHGGLGLRYALEAGVKSIEHGQFMYQFKGDIEALKKSGAYYVPTLSTMIGHVRRLESGGLTDDERRASEGRIARGGLSLEAARKAGVPIALGTDSGGGESWTEFEFFVKYGMSPMAAIVAGTTNAADLLGLSDQIGSVESGKNADIVAVDGDPLRDITVLKSVAFVMREGVVYRKP